MYGGPWVSRHNQISHGTTKNSHGTTKYFTAQPNISRLNQKLSRQNQINNGKTKFLIRGKTEKHTQKQITRCSIEYRSHGKTKYSYSKTE